MPRVARSAVLCFFLAALTCRLSTWDALAAPAESQDAFISPDAKRTYRAMVTDRGFPYEEHAARTRDGYVLTLQRIPPYDTPYRDHVASPQLQLKQSVTYRYLPADRPGTVRAKHNGKPPVLLTHGLLDWGVTWYLPGDDSFAFSLAKAGYDVWIQNNRGTKLSRSHTSLNEDSTEFWQFSWDEMAAYDFPDVVDYVLGATGATNVSYVGHSEGSLQGFAGLSLRPEMAAKLNAFVGIGPVYSLRHSANNLLELIANSPVYTAVKFLFHRSFDLTPSLLNKIAPYFCEKLSTICANVIFAICGKTDSQNIDSAVLEAMAAHETGGTSIRNILHWSQLLKNKRQPFRMFDYDSSVLNYMHYGQTTPPAYDFTVLRELIGVPFLLIGGDDDVLASATDMTVFKDYYMPPSAKALVVTDYDHLDLVWARSSPTKVFAPVLELLASL